MKKLFSILTLLLAVGFVQASNGKMTGKYTKQKTIKKNATVNADATLNIDNKYGSVMVTTWDENTIDLDVTVKVSSDDEKWTQSRLDEINIELSVSKSLFSAKTTLGNSKKSPRNSSIEINYVVKIPRNGNVQIVNKYGSVITHDLNGKADINCKYGNVSTGKLNNSKNNIDIQYCTKSSIDYIKSGSISAKYSGLTISQFGDITISSGYTDFQLSEGNTVKYQSNYGKLTFDKIKNIDGSGNYLTLKIGELSESLKISTNYSNFHLNQVSGKAKNISIHGNYTNINITHAPDYFYDFDVTTKYGNFKTNADLEYNARVETMNTKSYSGFYKKQGINKVTLSANYGNINLSVK